MRQGHYTPHTESKFTTKDWFHCRKIPIYKVAIGAEIHCPPKIGKKYPRDKICNFRDKHKKLHEGPKKSFHLYLQQILKSAITDHVAATNQTVGWEDSKMLCKESHRTRMWIKEAIHILKQSGHMMNRDAGNYQLPKIYHTATPTPRGGGPTRISIIPLWFRGCEFHDGRN